MFSGCNDIEFAVDCASFMVLLCNCHFTDSNSKVQRTVSFDTLTIAPGQCDPGEVTIRLCPPMLPCVLCHHYYTTIIVILTGYIKKYDNLLDFANFG